MEVYTVIHTKVDGMKHLSKFIELLKELCDVFELSSDTVHVFYDATGEADAFNHDHALFFNLHYYQEELAEKWSIDSMVYWFFSFCHILAHNFEKSHNSKYAVSLWL